MHQIYVVILRDRVKPLLKVWNSTSISKTKTLIYNFISFSRTEDTVEMEGNSKERVETADFSALDWKLEGCTVNTPLKKLLYRLLWCLSETIVVCVKRTCLTKLCSKSIALLYPIMGICIRGLHNELPLKKLTIIKQLFTKYSGNSLTRNLINTESSNNTQYFLSIKMRFNSSNCVG